MWNQLVKLSMILNQNLSTSLQLASPVVSGCVSDRYATATSNRWTQNHIHIFDFQNYLFWLKSEIWYVPLRQCHRTRRREWISSLLFLLGLEFLYLTYPYECGRGEWIASLLFQLGLKILLPIWTTVDWTTVYGMKVKPRTHSRVYSPHL